MSFRSIVTKSLLDAVKANFAIDLDGIHGIAHWGRVRSNGLRLARETGADLTVVELFALFHDAGRRSNRYDPGHGSRGAELAARWRGRHFDCRDDQLELLQWACRDHSDGHMSGDITVLTCWDADRLDLGRAGIVPDPRLLATAPARRPEMLEWCMRRSGYER